MLMEIDNIENEIWKVVNEEGLENYLISNKGRIMNSSTGLILKYFITKKGYYRVNLQNRKLKCQKKYAPHVLEAKTFLENPENKSVVNHKDGNKLNIDLSNLEWNTYSENLSHAFKNNLRSQDGEKNHNNVYPKDKIIKICEYIEKGKTTSEIRELVFGSNLDSDEKRKIRLLINNIQRREKWKSVSKDYKW